MTVSIIPARGGSKAIPKKNIVDFLGNPLIEYTIEQSKSCERIDETYVSTDDNEIAEVSREAGATVIDRPEEIAGDFASTEDALLHALGEMRADGVHPTTVVLLQCTSPLRRESDIPATVELVEEDRFDSALTCCEDHKFYWELSDQGVAEPINYDPKNRSMRQNLSKRYQENGSVYAVQTELLEEEECRLGGDIGIHEMPETHSFEIDTYEDLEIVEQLGRSVDFHHCGLLD
ncbi:acylneuraminate cytidylyltransferase family protein [Halorubrum sp. CBA1229]|uniref:acylneuraminate cytidylyltransferase family protein n=1 Tax=Halorubrum sp. CBA1229 TaxID=1853699 RepID=UPI000F4052CE|nr:acylneuraminate cytidylyltransferase family protein [Halorubrum sp. CBA1229]QKY15561.1 acylneuraminate cytidylyltransferase family protein [Halorubrum sp. CBA1229]